MNSSFAAACAYLAANLASFAAYFAFLPPPPAASFFSFFCFPPSACGLPAADGAPQDFLTLSSKRETRQNHANASGNSPGLGAPDFFTASKASLSADDACSLNLYHKWLDVAILIYVKYMTYPCKNGDPVFEDSFFSISERLIVFFY